MVYAESSEDFTVIKKLSESEKASFLSSFEEILFDKYYFGNPPEVTGYTVKINYSSGNYELISFSTAHYVKDETHYKLLKHCEKADLYALILDYII